MSNRDPPLLPPAVVAICTDGDGDPATLKLKRLLAAALTPALSIPAPAKPEQPEPDDLL